MSAKGFKLESVLLCDDIRREDNGKAILIGVYSGDIVIAEAPSLLGLSLWLQGTAMEAVSELDIRVQVFNVEHDAPTESKGASPMPFSVEPGNPFIIALGGIPVHITEAGHLAIQLKYGEQDWIEIIRRRIVISKAHSASGTPQPPA